MVARLSHSYGSSRGPVPRENLLHLSFQLLWRERLQEVSVSSSLLRCHDRGRLDAASHQQETGSFKRLILAHRAQELKPSDGLHVHVTDDKLILARAKFEERLLSIQARGRGRLKGGSAAADPTGSM